MRRPYLDNIRWTTQLLVVIYHVLFLYSAIEPELGLGPFAPQQYQEAFQYLVYPWFMALLFVVSGASSRLFLETHSEKEYVRARTRKLLVPSTLGILAFQWLQGLVNMRISGGGFDRLPLAARILITLASSQGVLWFLQLCWIYSMLLLPVRKLEQNRLYRFCKEMPVWGMLLLVFPLWGSAQILNVPMVTVYRVGIYGLCFFLGYFLFSQEAVTARLERFWLPLSLGAAGLFVAFLLTFWGQPYAHHQVLDTFLCNAYAWVSILAVFAAMKRFGNRVTPFSAWMNSWCWGLYLFHYLGISACGYFLSTLGIHTPWLCYPLTALSGLLGAWVLYRIIGRIPILRWCVLGMK